MPAIQGQGGPPPAPQRILFVDDEVNILDGLWNLLRKQRHDAVPRSRELVAAEWLAIEGHPGRRAEAVHGKP